MGKVTSSQNMLQAINEQVDIDNINSNKEIMCFYCRNPIKLDSFKEQYGKSGLKISSYFYTNSVKATLRSELSKLVNNEKDKTKVIEDIMEELDFKVYTYRIISCGHYFHNSCFIEGILKNKNNNNHKNCFICPLCLKKQNILIPS